MIQIKDCRYGKMLFNDKDQYIGEAVNHYGEFSESEVEFYRQLIPVGATVIDIGANIGGITIPLAKHVGDGCVHAFEPQRWVYYMLCANVLLNNLHRVYCSQLAVGESKGQTRMIAPTYEEYANYGGLSTQSDLSPDISEVVQVVRLDDLNLSPHFIKIDAEQAELEILKGGVQTLKRCRPFLSVEAIHDGKEIAHFLKEQGYKCFLFAFPGYNPDNYFQNKKNIFNPPAVQSPNFICIPKDVDFVINGERPTPVS